MNMPRTIEEMGDIAGKKVLLRLDLNVPIKDGKVFDEFRILKSLPTISYLREKGAKVILISHIGEDPSETLAPVADYLGIKLFPADPKNPAVAEGINNLKNGEAVLLENLRQNTGEILNDQVFARDLAGLADIYVDDAFAVMHRSHASVVSLPKLLPGYMGFLAAEEIDNLSKAFSPDHPFLFVLGGAKFSTKIGLVKKFADIADKIFIGGALANTVFNYLGLDVGKSLVDEKELDLSFIKNNPRIILPVDVKAINGDTTIVKKPSGILADDNMLDVGSETIAMLREEISKAKFILWNGPLGNYEKGFSGTTEELAKLISQSGAISIVGGGDTIASIKTPHRLGSGQVNLLDKFTFVSSGGGAMLDFLANGTLPGIEALKQS